MNPVARGTVLLMVPTVVGVAAACSDSPVSVAPPAMSADGTMAAGVVQTALLDGTSLLELDMEDAILAGDRGAFDEPRLDASTYASYGIIITNATIRTGPGLGEMFARSGTTYLEARRCVSDCQGRSSVPIRLTFSSARLGSVKRVRVHLGRVNERFFNNPPYILTCYNGPETVGSASGLPTIGYGDWVMTYLPLEVSGTKITDCTIQLDGLPVLDDIEIVSEPAKQAATELKCNGTRDSTRVTRADRVRCEVTGSTDIVGWNFVADEGAYRNPAEGATPFKGTVWEGPMVLSGAVMVRARSGSTVESKTVRVVVAPREWDALQMPRALSEEQPAPDLPTRPVAVHDLGDIHQGMELDFGRDKWEAVLSGPNANLAYLVTPPASYRGIIHVNRIALSVGSDFWNAQHTRQRTSGVVDCLRREQDIVGAIPVILRHEGIGFDPRSHAYLYVTEAERVGNPWYEQVVGATLEELADKSEAIRALARDSAVIASARADSTGYAPQMCRFHFNYRGR